MFVLAYKHEKIKIGRENVNAGLVFRVSEKNKFARSRRILVRMQGAPASAYGDICACGCNAAEGPKDKPDGVFIFCRDP